MQHPSRVNNTTCSDVEFHLNICEGCCFSRLIPSSGLPTGCFHCDLFGRKWWLSSEWELSTLTSGQHNDELGGGSTAAKVRGGQGSKVLLLCCLQEGSSRSYHCLSCHYWLIKLQISLHYYSYYYNLCYFCSSSNSSSFGEMYYKISG